MPDDLGHLDAEVMRRLEAHAKADNCSPTYQKSRLNPGVKEYTYYSDGSVTKQVYHPHLPAWFRRVLFFPR